MNKATLKRIVLSILFGFLITVGLGLLMGIFSNTFGFPLVWLIDFGHFWWFSSLIFLIDLVIWFVISYIILIWRNKKCNT